MSNDRTVTRVEVLTILFVAGLLALIELCAPAQAQESILLVIGDDMDPEWFPWSAPIDTHCPTLTKLSDRGTRWDNVWTSPRCAPSLASILTGLRPHQHGQTTNGCPELIQLDLSEGFGYVLEARGYRSMIAGKWWWDDPRNHGFDERFDWEQPWEILARPMQIQVFNFLASVQPGEPWFLWWAPKLPHLPHDAGPVFASLFPLESIPIPSYVDPADTTWRNRMRQYLANQARFDHELTRLGKRIRRLGLDKNLRVIFVNDNGWSEHLPHKGSWMEKGVRTSAIAVGASWTAGLVDPGLLLIEDVKAMVLGDELQIRPEMARVSYAGDTLGSHVLDAMAIVARDSAGRKLAWFPNDVLEADNGRWGLSLRGTTPFPCRLAGTIEETCLSLDPWETMPIPAVGNDGDPLWSSIQCLWRAIRGE